ncbi:MAG: tRNA (guanosine(37)-N1)-methyltransferase TrmD [Legionellales bacterium]|jgi:tRNA (guanine37-N1)-methyltransferase
MLRFDVITLFPEMFNAVTDVGITGRAVRNRLAMVNYWNPRDFAEDKHHTVDDKSYGGGPGMVMKPEPLRDAIFAAQDASTLEPSKVVYLSPQGQPLTQSKVRELTTCGQLILIAGRYEGIDERIVTQYVDEEISIGDYVLSGGELAAMVIMDAVIRLLPGALHCEQSALEDSFSNSLLDHPHYTRPEIFEGQHVPSVLASGNHESIRKWRLQQALGRTWLRKPSLLKNMRMDPEQQILLREFIHAYEKNPSNFNEE